jgi:hypothetical protein
MCKAIVEQERSWGVLSDADWFNITYQAAPPRTFDRPGLESLVECARGTAEFAIPMPWNLATHGPAMGLPRERKILDCSYNVGRGRDKRRVESVADYYVETYARMAGFILELPGYPVLSAFVRRTVSPNGMGSPYTSLDLWDLQSKYGSPGAAQRALIKVRRRANEILKPYGLTVSNAALAIALVRDRRVGKAALRAAAGTLMQYCGINWTWGKKPWQIMEWFRGLAKLKALDLPANDRRMLIHWRGEPFYSGESIGAALEWIENMTALQILDVANQEVRRILVQIRGMERLVRELNPEKIDNDEFGTLYRISVPGNNDPIVVVHVVNSTPEPDGTYREFFLRVPPRREFYPYPAIITALDAVAWTFEMTAEEYAPIAQS